MNDKDKKRFLSKIKKTRYCWLWEGTIRSKGYGSFKIRNKVYQAHRLSYNLFIGKIPDGLDICHKCDNPTCVNPKHLFVGTASDNMQDCANKGRLYMQNFPLDKYKPHNKTGTWYGKGCRCDLCKEFQRKERAKSRKKHWLVAQ